MALGNRGRGRWEQIQDSLRNNEQGHVLQFFEQLGEEERLELLQQVEKVDYVALRREVLRLWRPSGAGFIFKPASCTQLASTPAEKEHWRRAEELGRTAIASGHVAVITVAGGQATRLGFDHSKGMFPITPVKGKSLFQLFAEKIHAWERRCGRDIFWLILSSPTNHRETCDFFSKNGNFGLRQVHIFPQGVLPSLDRDGRLILEKKNAVAMHPDGHGGLLEALGRSGLLPMLRENGVEHLSYFQVDNPLAMPIDPAFIGFHIQQQSQFSSRCVVKKYAAEKVGVFVESDGRLRVVEYMDLSAECSCAQDASGRLRFGWANVAIHLFSLDFLEPFCHDCGWQVLPFHLSQKKIPYLNGAGHLVRPVEANGFKLERFIFDLLPRAERALLLEGRREEMFSPVKNAAGLDSVETSQRDQVRQFAEWLSKGRVDLSRDDSGLPPFFLEISPLFADTMEEFLQKWAEMPIKPAVGANFYLE
ncbi:MAG: UDPGP type 1 family protein [Puniceicoccales bacterium]|jgi:UDP-N-acetylglucosamine/UDP-N-acetylgalactosamine diphosphorylase|nr:UDPGP type 1 family protein [Puniceicoccales bacterium]